MISLLRLVFEKRRWFERNDNNENRLPWFFKQSIGCRPKSLRKVEARRRSELDFLIFVSPLNALILII
jgi:hypothetical protein